MSVPGFLHKLVEISSAWAAAKAKWAAELASVIQDASYGTEAICLI